MLFVGLDPGDAEIVVAAQIDVVVGRILVVVHALKVALQPREPRPTPDPSRKREGSTTGPTNTLASTAPRP